MKHLLLIDIQGEYHKDFTSAYVINVLLFIMQFRRQGCLVTNIIDSSSSRLDFSYFKSMSDITLVKSYNKKFVENIIENEFRYVIIDQEMDAELNCIKYMLKHNVNLLKGKNNYLVLIQTSNNNYYISSITLNMYKYLSAHQNDTFFLVGGYKDRCVQQTYKILQKLGLQSMVIDALCY